MIEIITGISLLASSISMQINASKLNTANTESIAPTETVATTTATSTNATAIEGRFLSYQAHVKEYFKDDPILIDIARCESTFRQYRKDGKVMRGIVNPADVGIMQINEKYHLERSKSLGYDIYTVEGNLAYAKEIYEDQGAAPWSASSKCWSKPIAMK